MVEFALVLPIFLIILFGLLDGGRYVFMNNVLSQAAREGARVAAAEARFIGATTLTDPSCVASQALITAANPGAHVCPATVAIFKADITSAANRMVAPFGAVDDVYVDCMPVATTPTANWPDGPCSAANRVQAKNAVWVRVDLTFHPVTPLAQSWTPQTSASATMVIN